MLAALPAEALRRAGADAAGSRALEAFFAGAAPAKAKRRLLRRLLGGIGALAAEPGGSHVVQAAYAAAVRLSDLLYVNPVEHCGAGCSAQGQ